MASGGGEHPIQLASIGPSLNGGLTRLMPRLPASTVAAGISGGDVVVARRGGVIPKIIEAARSPKRHSGIPRSCGGNLTSPLVSQRQPPINAERR